MNEPFAVINADDFYGADSYKVLNSYLTQDQTDNYAVVAYYLRNTLSDHGTVNRGVCYSNDDNYLTKVVECTKDSARRRWGSAIPKWRWIRKVN